MWEAEHIMEHLREGVVDVVIRHLEVVVDFNDCFLFVLPRGRSKTLELSLSTPPSVHVRVESRVITVDSQSNCPDDGVIHR